MAARLPGNGKSGAANLQDRQGGMAPESGGADPFDPEAFNRRYAPPERMAPSAEEPQDYFGAAETPAQSPRSAKPIPSEIPEDGARFER